MPGYRHWDEAEVTRLRNLIESGMSYEKTAKIIKLSVSSTYKACLRLGIHRPKTESTAEQIVSLCTTTKGMTPLELHKATKANRGRVGKLITELINKGLLHRAGVPNLYRYFTSSEAAIEHDLAMERQKLEKLEAKRRARKVNSEAIKIARRERSRELAELARKAEGQARQATPIAPSKPLLVTPPPVVEIVQGVKVTRYQTPPNLFDFTPPPGWRGQITHDWMDRRLQGVQHE